MCGVWCASMMVLAACTPASQTNSSHVIAPTSLAAMEDMGAHPLTSADREADQKVERKDSSGPVTVEQKLQALENRVHFLESQMNASQPTLNKVEAMDRRFQELSGDLKTIRGGGAVPATPYLTKGSWVEAGSSQVKDTKKTSPKAETVKKTPVKKAGKADVIKPVAIEPKPAAKLPAEKGIDQAGSTHSAVTSVRIGPQKNGATRIVLDTTQASALHYDLDNGEKILVIDLPQNSWKSEADKVISHGAEGSASDSLLVSSYHASEDESGAHLILKLKEASKVTATARLTPAGGHGHRVYVDVMPLK